MFGWLKRKKTVAVPVATADFKALKAGLARLSKKALCRLILNLAAENHKLTMLVAQKKIVIKGETRKPIDSQSTSEV